MSLTDIAVRNAKPIDKAYKLSDADGMFLLVNPNGGKYWRLKYRFLGKEKLLALGVYPETSLADARGKRTEARKILADGNDPGEAKKEVKRQLLINAENSFEAVGREFFNQLVQCFRFRLVDPMILMAAIHELDAIFFHHVFFLFAHRLAQTICFAQRETRELIGDLHHLFLIQNDAVSLLQNILQLRQFVADLGFSVFAVDEIVDHAALNRPWAIQRVQRGQILNSRRLVAPQYVAHAVRFELENRRGVAAREKFVSVCII